MPSQLAAIQGDGPEWRLPRRFHCSNIWTQMLDNKIVAFVIYIPSQYFSCGPLQYFVYLLLIVIIILGWLKGQCHEIIVTRIFSSITSFSSYWKYSMGVLNFGEFSLCFSTIKETRLCRLHRWVWTPWCSLRRGVWTHRWVISPNFKACLCS